MHDYNQTHNKMINISQEYLKPYIIIVCGVVLTLIGFYFYNTNNASPSNNNSSSHTNIRKQAKHAVSAHKHPLKHAVGARKHPSRSTFVKQNESLTNFLAQQNVSLQDILHITFLPQVYNHLQKVRAGQKFQLHLANHHQLESFKYFLSPKRELIIHHTNQGYTTEIENKGEIQKLRIANLTIDNSIAAAAKSIHLSASIVAQLARVFGADIDFRRDIRKGAKLSILYQETYKNNQPIHIGPIIAARLINHKRIFQAFRDVNSKGQINYYNADGKNLKKAFMRAPTHYQFVSSSFNMHRMHPILHIVRPHEGVDLAAPKGTPILASSNGIITFIGAAGGYGNCIKIRNSNKYSTLFGHMSRFARGLKKGSHVKKGQVIGYVGETGLATGPHLHYELHIYGKPVNPMTAKLPHARPIPKKQKAHFKVYAENLEKQL